MSDNCCIILFLQARAKKIGVSPSMMLPGVISSISSCMNTAKVSRMFKVLLIVVIGSFSYSYLKDGSLDPIFIFSMSETRLDKFLIGGQSYFFSYTTGNFRV